MIFFLIDIGLVFIYGLNIVFGQPSDIVTRLVNLDDESSISSWYSSIQYFCVFLFAAIFSYQKIKFDKKSLPLIVFPALFLLLSIDEATSIHEWLGDQSDVLFSSGTRYGTAFESTGLWMFIVGIPFLVLFLWFIYMLRQHIADNVSSLKKLVLGMIIMLTGALGFEFLSNFAEHTLLILFIILEEGLEMVGVTVMLWAAYDMAIGYIVILDEPSIST